MAKVMLIILGVVVLIGAILALVAPKSISVTNTQFIQASKQDVFDQIRYLKNFPNWSPFKVQDPEQKSHVTGNDGEVGATFHWEGVKEKSVGSQTITAISGNDKLTLTCNITVPFQSNPVFEYTLVEKNGGVELTQNFYTQMPVPTNIIGLLMGLKGEISAINKQGLSLLKKVTEQKTSSAATSN
jgi:hypothetical protein